MSCDASTRAGADVSMSAHGTMVELLPVRFFFSFLCTAGPRKSEMTCGRHRHCALFPLLPLPGRANSAGPEAGNAVDAKRAISYSVLAKRNSSLLVVLHRHDVLEQRESIDSSSL